jgi:hypothetical protein
MQNNEAMSIESSASAAVQPPAVDATSDAPDTKDITTVVPDSSDGSTAPTKETATAGTTGRNWEKEYQSVAKLREQEQKNFNELRKKLIAQGTERNNLEKEVGPLRQQLQALTDALSKAGKAEITPEQFLEGLQTEGPKFLENWLAERDKDLSGRFEGRMSEMATRLRKREVSAAVRDRRSDAEGYPDFAKMEPTMSDIMMTMREEFKNGLLPTDPDSVDPDELTDYLYNLARLQHSQDAIKAAEAEGAQKARSELAREAETSVAGGGKQTSSQVPNLDKLSLSQERDYWVKKIGETDF